jgi:hypothetical protein
MYPIIRRIRQPVLPAETPETAPEPSVPVTADVTRLKLQDEHAGPRLLSATKSGPGCDQPRVPDVPVCPPFLAPPPDNEKRTNSVQFCSVSPGLPPSPRPLRTGVVEDPVRNAASSPPPARRGSENEGTISGSSHPPTPKPQPPSLWSRQPGESAEDFQIFAAWLQLPVPRPVRRAAASALHCSLHRLRRLFVRHRWKTRTAAFDNHRAYLASEAVADILRNASLDWRERAQRFRLQEWLLHEQMVAAAHQAVRELSKQPRRASLAEVSMLADLASVLGRRAVGIPLDAASVPPVPPPFSPGWQEALHKVYAAKAGSDRNPADSPGPEVPHAPSPTQPNQEEFSSIS